MKKGNSFFGRCFRYLIYALPAVLFFSYFPLITLGESEAMFFELSLPLIWLVVFFVVGLVLMIQKRNLFDLFKRKSRILLLAFPVWLSLSVIWSANSVRGVLVAGIMWLVFFAGYAMWNMRELFDDGFRRTFLKWFFASTLVACGWCVVQCVLDLVGVSREYSLMCEGCTYQMFGFPHPNGFAIEPQFMGNLLLAPAMVAVWLFVRQSNSKSLERRRLRGVVSTTAKSDSDSYSSTRSSSVAVVETTTGSRFLCSRLLLIPYFLISATLFLTFSRGAIYAFVVGMMFMTGFVVVRAKKSGRKLVGKRMGVVWGVTVLAFAFTLNMQGIMSAVGPTNDTYGSGVAKVLNHLSLGIIDVRGEGDGAADAMEPVENSVENIEENNVENFESNRGDLADSNVENKNVDLSNIEGGNESKYDGYVAASTDIRVEMNKVALETWASEPQSVLFGVGLGGAGQAIYDHGLTGIPREIVQNQYVSLLLETGVVGVVILIVTGIFVIRFVAFKKESGLFFSLSVCYLVSLLFFAGLPNALQVYLMPVVILAICDKVSAKKYSKTCD